jgi:hypothetical protein
MPAKASAAWSSTEHPRPAGPADPAGAARATAGRPSADPCGQRRKPLPLAAAFRQGGDRGWAKDAPPAVGHDPGLFGLKRLVARVYFAFTHSSPPTPAAVPATWSPAAMWRIIRGRGRKGTGEQRAGHARTVGQSAVSQFEKRMMGASVPAPRSHTIRRAASSLPGCFLPLMTSFTLPWFTSKKAAMRFWYSPAQ